MRCKNGEKCKVHVFCCYGTRSCAAGSRRTVTGKSGLQVLALLLSLLWHCVAVALGRTQQAAGEILIGKSGLPELAPLLSARSPVSTVASPSSSRTVCGIHIEIFVTLACVTKNKEFEAGTPCKQRGDLYEPTKSRPWTLRF